LSFGQRQRETAVQGVAGTERIDRADGEYRHAAQQPRGTECRSARC
jgi:hypothetical protein